MQSITLLDQNNLSKFVTWCHAELDKGNNKKEMVLRNRQESATLAQFKAIFGAWFKYLQDHHNQGKDHFHKKFKTKFLVRIYENEPTGKFQEMWAENIILWTERGNIDKALQARDRISLSWATKEQMCMYMRDIEIYWIEKGEPLPVIEKSEHRKSYEGFCRRLGI
jgi:hypothetical protein